MSDIDTISVEASEVVEAKADGVSLLVVVQGSALFSGGMAVKKAKEVSALAEELKSQGVKEEDIEVESITADVQKGVISRTSSATYRLQIHCGELESLADILGVITSQKQAKLLSMRWQYSAVEDLRASMLDAALTRVKEKGRQIASIMDVELLGVHQLTEKFMDPDVLQTVAGEGILGSGPARLSRKLPAPDLGVAISHKKELRMDVTVKYRVKSSIS